MATTTIKHGAQYNGSIIASLSTLYVTRPGSSFSYPDNVDSLSQSVVTVTSTQSVDITKKLILCDASSGELTLTLPSAVNNKGIQISFKKIDATGYKVVIVSNSNIDGVTTWYITDQYSNMTLMSNGSEWCIL